MRIKEKPSKKLSKLTEDELKLVTGGLPEASCNNNSSLSSEGNLLCQNEMKNSSQEQ